MYILLEMMCISFPEAPVNCRWTMVSIRESFFKRACVFPDQIYRYPMLLQSSLIEEMSSLKCGPTPSINGTCNLKVVLCWVTFTMALKCQEMSSYFINQTFLRKLLFDIDWNGTNHYLLAQKISFLISVDVRTVSVRNVSVCG